MAQLFNVRMPDGQDFRPGDFVTTEPLYSTVEMFPGAWTVLTAFSYGLGADVPGSVGPRQSNGVDTNLQGEGNRLPENEELFIYSLGIELFLLGIESTADAPMPLAPAPFLGLLNTLRVQRDVLVTTRIGADSKRYTHAPLSFFPGGTGVDQYNSGALYSPAAGTVSGFVVGNNGGPNTYDSRELASPLHVAGGETFGVDLTPGPGQIEGLALNQNPGGTIVAGRVRARIYCDGLRRRPIA